MCCVPVTAMKAKQSRISKRAVNCCEINHMCDVH